MTERPDSTVAVVGLECIFPGAADARAYWRNIESGHDAIGTVGGERWDPVFHDPTSNAVDRFPTTRGGTVGRSLPFEASTFGIMPIAAEGAEPDQMLALQVAARCLEDASAGQASIDRSNVGVVLGRGGYLTPGMVRLNRKVREAEQLSRILEELAPQLEPGQRQAIKEAFQAEAGPYGPDTAIGLVPNLTASRIANRLDLQGPAFTLDAACASSLIAVELACRELRAGRAEMMLAGGVHLTHDPTFWSVFSQLGALSRTGQIRPFDRRADGLLIGEGVGVVALKLASRAMADGDRIYAFVRGVGSSSDGRASTVMVPRVEGQVLALNRAWRDAGLDPNGIGLVEAHGTGTAAGDVAELRTLARVFGPADGKPRVPLGSVKSMIGHAMPAAGIAGFIKAVWALHHGVIPPSLHCEEPRMELETTRFRVPAEAEPWETEGPRLAAVNAFGFGGINAHVVLEGVERVRKRRRKSEGKALETPDLEVLRIAGADPQAVLAALDNDQRGGVGPCRLAVLDPTPERVERARKVVARGEAWPGRGGIWFRPEGLLDQGAGLVFVYPGVEALFTPRVDDLAEQFELPLPEFTEPRNLEETGRGVVSLARFLTPILERLGLEADAMAGHSIGEWSAMVASGILPGQAVDEFLQRARPGSLEVPGVLFAAAGCGLEVAQRAVEGLEGIAVSHDNCPHQIILCGHEEPIETARRRLIAEGVICQVLPFRSGFHSPLFEPYLDVHKKHFNEFPIAAPQVPMWSATTTGFYPDDPDAIRRLTLRHLVEPLRFRELIERMYEHGHRVFVQVGTGSVVGFVDDTLGDRPHLAVAAVEGKRPGRAQLRNLAVALWVEGAEIELDGLVPPQRERGPTMDLALSSSLISLPDALRGSLEAAVPELARSPAPNPPEAKGALGRLFADNLAALGEAQTEVLDALSRGGPPATMARPELHRTLNFSVEEWPDLRDHSFFPQPTGWPTPSDGYPVVPMTMTVKLLMDAAAELDGERVPVELVKLRAFRWLVVEPPVRVVLRAHFVDADTIKVELEGYAEAELRMAAEYPTVPKPWPWSLRNARSTPVDAEALYGERWMFHGPRYQGVINMGPLGDDGLEGVIATPRAPGALLDNAGQLLGYWVMGTQASDQLAMPTGVDRFEFFGPHPEVGEHVKCRVRILGLDERELRADLELLVGDRVWCRIHNWTDHRFQTDAHLWLVMRQPEHNLLSDSRVPYRFYDNDAHRSPSRDWLMRRYLGEAERKAMLDAGPRRQRHFLHGRIAAKDAVRELLWAEGHGPLFPVHVQLVNDAQGVPHVKGFPGRDLRVSLAHCGDCAVALATEGRAVGIDIERVEERPEGFVDTAFAPADRALIEGDDRAELITRMWSAKEALAKFRRTGLEGNPRRLVVQEVQTDRLLVDGHWVNTRREGDYIVAWIVE